MTADRDPSGAAPDVQPGVPAQPGSPENGGSPEKGGSPQDGGSRQDGGSPETVRTPGDVRPPGVLRQILGRDQDDEGRPLPDLPPLPEDPRWRIEHLPMITAIGLALSLCAGSAGFLIGGVAAGLGVAGGVFVVAVGFSLSTLAIAWADVIRPALVMPVGLTVYVIKYALIGLILLAAGQAGWVGARPMAYGIAIGAVAMTAVQVWWISRLANRRLRNAS